MVKDSKTVYVITIGDYSSYRIVGVTMNKERAQKLKKLCNTRFDEARIETYILDERKASRIYKIAFDEDGNVIRFGLDTMDYWKNGDVVYGEELDEDLVVYVEAMNENHAIKFAQDRRAEYLAAKEGIT